MKVHVHDWVLNGAWKCIAPDHVHDQPDILDAASIWHALGVIKTHRIYITYEGTVKVCECGWQGTEYYEHLDDAVFYWLRSISETI